VDTGLGGRRLTDRYVLEEELASGGMGALWLARDEVLGRSVAIKVLHAHLAGDEALLDRFRMEAVAAARLSHPAVVRVFDTGTSGDVVFIVMELVQGETVSELLEQRGTLPAAEAAMIARGVLQALAHAHREGMIHRDVKPGNVLVTRGDHVKLADFGIAKAAFADEDLTTTGNLLGTSRYLSPEQVSGGEVDARSDLYAVGVVLYEMLTGRPPFEAETHIATATMRLTGNPAPPRSLKPGIPRKLEAVVMRALARDPSERFQSAEEMTAAIDRAVPGAELPPDEPRYEEPAAQRSLIRSWVMVPFVLALAAALAVGGFLLLEGFRRDRGTPAAPGAERAGPLEVSRAYSFDPGGDQEEHDENLSSAIDGDPSTSWATEGYTTADLGGIKEGVGLVLELEEAAEVGGVSVQTELPAWEFSVFPGDTPGTFDMSAPLGSFQVEEGGTYELDPTETRYVLVWLTNLVPDGQGDYRAVVNEIDLLPPSG
jgi:serine/threonine-protein kinase